MQEPIEESEKAQHPAEANQFRDMQQLTQRRNRQRGDNEDQRPISRLMGDVLNGIGSQLMVECSPGQLTQRHEACDEYRKLNPFAAQNFSQTITLSG